MLVQMPLLSILHMDIRCLLSKKLKKQSFPEYDIVVGNIATGRSNQDVGWGWKADAVWVGIGRVLSVLHV